MGVIGEREVTDGTVAVRRRGMGKKQEVMERSAFIDMVLEEVRSKSLG
jgi:threonyl-tRNA synthetase